MPRKVLKLYPLKDKNNKGIFTPTQVLALGFLVLILTGTILLSLPLATNGKKLSLLDALFTATSATCVTGLVVVDTGTYFSHFGQGVILFLIEIGGLGFMTFATMFAIFLGKRITLKERILLQEALNQQSLEGIVRLAKSVLGLTFLIQMVGAFLLTIRFLPEMGLSKAAYYGVFHSISAFNNAGFDIFGNFTSLTASVNDWFVNIVVIALIVLGGLGFLVLTEVYLDKGKRISLHSRIVLKTSAILIALGTISILFFEYSNPQTLGGLSGTYKLWAALFQSVTTRTAGFNTISLADMRETSLILVMLFMFIGASPGSTGGGIKTTTFVAVVLSVINTYRGKNQVVIGERTLPDEIIKKALAIVLTGVLWVIVVTAVLTITEKASFIALLFETTSAFGTVGLSMGITPQLSSAGKVAIMLTMYAGRVGPLTLAFALAQKRKVSTVHVKYPEEKILIG